MIINNKRLEEPIRLSNIYSVVAGVLVFFVMLVLGYNENYYIGSEFFITYILMMTIIALCTFLVSIKSFYIDNDKIEYRAILIGRKTYSYSDIKSCRLHRRISLESLYGYEIILTMKDDVVIKLKDSMYNYIKLKNFFLDKNIL